MNGYLSVHSFTSAARIPVEGVTFTITQRRAQGVELLAVRIADESGQTGTAHLYIRRGRWVGGDILLEGKDTAPLQKRAVQED